MSNGWTLAHRAHPAAVAIADRHYNRQKVGTPQFVPPGRCIVLLNQDAGGNALWVTSWPFAQYVKHAWAGAWVNSLFRNESRWLSSLLIREAVAITRSIWDPPPIGIVTFVDASKVRRKRDPGYCYLMAGFENVGKTAGGLVALQLLPDRMPDPVSLLESAPPAPDSNSGAGGTSPSLRRLRERGLRGLDRYRDLPQPVLEVTRRRQFPHQFRWWRHHFAPNHQRPAPG